MVWREGVFVLAEDIRSRWNVGSLFRSMDGLGGLHLFLTGICCTPPDPKIHGSALGAEEAVSWSYTTGALPVLAQARRHGVEIVALESTPRAVDLRHAPRAHPSTLIVVGNEIEGVSPEVLARCDRHVHVPMHGRKRSLNVAVAAALALWRYTAPASADAASSGPP